MISVLVTRNELSEIQTIGRLDVVNGDVELFSCMTLELAWNNNLRQISCIPYGEYSCEKKEATAAIPYQHITVLNVRDRSGIAIHKANYASQLRGCIAVGDKHVDINKDGNLDVTNSSNTFKKLMDILPNNFKLTIK
jgi:hypothetical protein